MAPHELHSGLFLNGQKAWHGLGTVLNQTLSADEAFRRASALFPVETLQLWAGDITSPALLRSLVEAAEAPSAERTDAFQQALQQHLISMEDNRIGIWRPDERRILGTASPGYQVIPNHRLLDFASALREECDMDTVVVLRGGAKVAFTAKIRSTERDVVPGDTIFRNLIGYIGHDGSTAFGGLLSNTRVVCSNTLGFAQADANRHGRQFVIRHTENDIAQIDHIIGSIDIARQTFGQVVDEFRAMRDVPMSMDLYRHWLEQVYQIQPVRLNNGDTRPGRIEDMMPRKAQALLHAWDHGLGRDIPGVAGTLWWALNCVSEVESSQLTKGAGKRRMHSSLFGSGRTIITRANDLARSLSATG